MPRPEVSEVRKRQILEAASEVFARKGFYEARMEDIAEQTGLSKGTLYLYFDSKDDLIIAFLDLIFQREFQQLESLNYQELSATEMIGGMIDLILADVSSMMKLMPIAYEFLALAFRNEEVQGAFKQYINRYMSILIPVIQHGVETGEFRDVDPREVAIAIGAIIEGTLLLWVYDKNLVNLEHHMHSGISFLIEGIRST